MRLCRAVVLISRRKKKIIPWQNSSDYFFFNFFFSPLRSEQNIAWVPVCEMDPTLQAVKLHLSKELRAQVQALNQALSQ